jgi:hypothetical protein
VQWIYFKKKTYIYIKDHVLSVIIYIKEFEIKRIVSFIILDLSPVIANMIVTEDLHCR